MDPIWQQVIVGVVVGGALVYLVRRGKKSKCETGDCGCSAKTAAKSAAGLKDGHHPTSNIQHPTSK